MTPEMASLLQQHLSGAPAGDTLAQLVGDDPELAAIAQLLSRREQQLEAQLREEELEEERPLDIPLAAEDDRVELLRDQVASFADDVTRIRDTLELVSAALGACPTCLGADDVCALCHGRGVPGSLPPDPVAFDQIVMPAVRAHAFTRSRTGRGLDQENPKTETPDWSTP
ncbi:hypothetical protein [Agrococcus sp. DT81.2]|uniref:hypothetical protein n=1 Tax=Agrococcus sp. DT81.2 TaxID=3393414 RepID=UPI003CE4E1BA